MTNLNKPHQTPEKSLKIVKFVMMGISALAFLSAFSMPWSAYSKKETTLAILTLVFINGYLFWTYKLIYVWKKRFLENLEHNNNVEIVAQIGGAYKVLGNVSFVKKLSIQLKILLYFGLGMIFPLVVGIGAIYLINLWE
ncbi:MAG: hypothetical protein COA33_001775 [Fluviicola sp.]|nr:hypothetical protein [Fluviicola sp.]